MAQDLIDRFTPLHTNPINGSAIATWAIIAGHRALKFANGGGNNAYFASVLNSLYNATGIRVTLVWSASVALAGVTWSVAFERQASGVFTYSSGSSFATGRTVVAGAPAGVQKAVYSTIDFTNAQIDGLLKLEAYRLTVSRTDAVALDAYLHRVFLQNLT